MSRPNGHGLGGLLVLITPKILFLDVDGVLCTRRSFLAYDKEGTIWYSWDQVAVDAVLRACRKSVLLVVSSTWRKPEHVEDFHAQCAKYKILPEYFFKEDWKTPVTKSGVRGEEIKLWLDAHPDVKDYKILDDDCILLDQQEKHWIRTDMEEGMTSANMKKLLNWAGVLRA